LIGYFASAERYFNKAIELALKLSAALMKKSGNYLSF